MWEAQGRFITLELSLQIVLEIVVWEGGSQTSLVPDGISSLDFPFFCPFCDPRGVELVLDELPHWGTDNIDTDFFPNIPGVFARNQGDIPFPKGLLFAPCEEQLLLKLAEGSGSVLKNMIWGIRSKKETSTTFRCFWNKNTIQPSSGWMVHGAETLPAWLATPLFSSSLVISMC